MSDAQQQKTIIKPLNRDSMVERLRVFAHRVLNLCGLLKGSYDKVTVGQQLFRCATSVAVRYRVAQHAISTKDFLNKMKVCEEEADETCYWLQLLVDGGIVASSRMNSIILEANEIAAIISASCITARAHLKSQASSKTRAYKK